MSKKLNKLDHTVPIYSPRTSYKLVLQNDENLLADLTLNFDPFTINVLKNEFFIRNWEMKITEFILVVKEHLLSWQIDISNRDIKLIRSLTNLFQEIDLNGNGVLEWEEFTNYIIEKATVLNNIKTKQDEIKLYTKSSMKPEMKFQQIISKIIYIPEIDRIAFYEDGSDKVQVMTPDGGYGIKLPLQVCPKPLIVQLSQVKKEADGTIHIEKKENIITRKTMILAILYIPDQKYQVLLTSSNDGYVRGWRYTSSGYVLANQPDNDEEMIEHHFVHEIYCLAWDGIGEILYCGQKDGVINIWNLKTDTETTLEQEGAHTEVVMDMIAMPKLQFMASAALDCNLILWDTIKNTKKRTYKEHTRGIVSLAFNESLILLFSAGFDHDLCVWNPYIDNLIFKIQGHSSPLVGVQVIEGTSQVVSLDSEGQVKIWDTKKFNCVQQFSVETSDEKHKFNPQSFCYIPKPLKLVFAGRSVSLYEYDKNYNPNSVDDYVAICCKFIQNQMAFFTPAGNKIKIWNALTGDIKRIYSDITTGEITAFALDNLQKRMIIGDSQGLTALFNVINGAKIKALPKHTAEVTSIFHAPDIMAFFTAAMDNRIHMTLDNEFGESELLRNFTVHEAVITLITYDPSTKLVLAGTNTGSTVFFETDTSKLHGTSYETSNIEEITSLNIIDKMPFMITTNSQGRVHVVALPPLLHRFTKIFTFINIDPEAPSQNLGISNGVFCQVFKRLFVTDDKGFIKCYDLAWIVDLLAEHIKAKQDEELKKPQKLLNKDASNGGAKSLLQLPKIAPRDIQPFWYVRGHYEIIKSLEYVLSENILITTAFDKKVKIWDSLTGKGIDSFQQNYDRKDPRPIAYKRSGTEEIYSPDLEERVDLKLLQDQRKNNGLQSADTYRSQEQKSGRHSVMSHGSNKQKGGNDEQQEQTQGQGFAKSAEEEFNPFYFLDKIDKSKLKNYKSNPEWKLNLNFTDFYSDFEKGIEVLIEEVKFKEIEVHEKQVKQGIHNRHFKVTQFKSEDDTKKFDENHKPIINENQNQDDRQQLQSQNGSQYQNENPKKNVLVNAQKQLDKHGVEKKNFEGNIQPNQQQQQQRTNSQQPVQQMQRKSISELNLLNKVKRKPNAQVFEKLHRNQLKSKLLFKAEPDVYLSQTECDAAYKLAAALANYDKDDYRSLKFLDIKAKEASKKSLVSKLLQQNSLTNSESNLKLPKIK